MTGTTVMAFITGQFEAARPPERESGPAELEDVTDLSAASVLMSDATETALAEVPGQVEEAALDDEDDMPVWEIEIQAEDRPGLQQGRDVLQTNCQLFPHQCQHWMNFEGNYMQG